MSSGAFHEAIREGLTHDNADFVIVGSGAGGGAAARVLSEAGYSVIVLEDGPLMKTGELRPTATDSLARLMRNRGQMAAFGRANVPILQGRCVGGTTFVNSAICWRLPEKVLAKWRKEFGLTEAFPDEALDRAYETIERDMNIRAVSDENVGGADRLMKIAAEQVGLESRAIHRNEKGCKGSARCLFGCPNDAKQSTAINYLRKAVDAGAHVFANAKVERVLTEGGRAVAVTGHVSEQEGPFARKPFKVQARKGVILSGSVFGSPNLLRQSGIALGSKALGEHFQAHPGLAVMGFYPHEVNAWSGAAQGYEVYGLRDTLGVKFESINVPPEVTAARLPGAGLNFARYADRLMNIASWSLAVKADAEGSVRPSRLFGDYVRYTLTPSDVDRVRKGVKKLVEMHLLAGATEVLPGIHGLPDVITSVDQLSLFDSASLDPRSYSMIATHLFGTCRAGTDPKTSVVNQQLRVHDVEGLYVMDASIFPTNTGVNPQHSIMALATVAAERLAATSGKAVKVPEPREITPAIAAAS